MIPKPMTDSERQAIYNIIDDWYLDDQIAPVLVKRLREAGYPIVHWADILEQVLGSE